MIQLVLSTPIFIVPHDLESRREGDMIILGEGVCLWFNLLEIISADSFQRADEKVFFSLLSKGNLGIDQDLWIFNSLIIDCWTIDHWKLIKLLCRLFRPFRIVHCLESTNELLSNASFIHLFWHHFLNSK
jgi:hypothetical protein